MSTQIHQREDVDATEGLEAYGEVTFADPVNHKYPVDTPEHVRAAWSYIHHQDNAAKYRSEEVAEIKKRIRRAAGHHGVELHPE